MREFLWKCSPSALRQGEFLTAPAGASLYDVVRRKTIWKAPEEGEAILDTAGLSPGLYCWRAPEGHSDLFRILARGDLDCYTIAHCRSQGVDVFALDGGMSAEYAVEKSLEALTGGVSHSWFTLPEKDGQGPRPVYATPEFLERSVARTVEYYDEYLGKDRVYDTVLLSSGVMPAAYVSRVMKAPVLPLQYLVSANSVRELERIGEYSGSRGLSCYLTYSYDASMKSIGVAWCELLRLPEAYREFLRRHQVKTVLFLGSSGVKDGETTARRVITDSRAAAQGIHHGDIFLMYPGVSNWENGRPRKGLEETQRLLKEHVTDFEELTLAPGFIRMGDWESGLEPEQLAGIEADLQKALPDIAVARLLKEDALELYRCAPRLMGRFLQKNRRRLPDPRQLVRGVVLNPYLLAHPLYESYCQQLPCLYWQFTDPRVLARDRAGRDIAQALEEFCPETERNGLPFHINATQNFGGFQADALRQALEETGAEAVTLNPRQEGRFGEETFRQQSPPPPCARILGEMATLFREGISLSEWDRQLVPLTVEEVCGL